MSWNEDLRILVETKFKAEWNYSLAGKIDFGDNSGFSPPADGSNWVRISFNIITNQNAEVGVRYQKARGILTVQCFSKLDEGEKATNDMVGKAGDIFQNKNFNGLYLFAMTPLKVGAIKKWYQQNAKIDFIYNVFS